MSPVDLKAQQQQQEMLYFSNDSIANPDGSDDLSSAEAVAPGKESQLVSPPLVPSNTCTPFGDTHGAKEDSLPFPEDEPHRFITQSTDSGTSTNDEEEKDEASKFRSSGKRKLPPETFERTRFKDVIGHGSVKMRIEEILLPLALPPCVADAVLTGIRALPASIMLYGPPGCGKVRALSTNRNAILFVLEFNSQMLDSQLVDDTDTTGSIHCGRSPCRLLLHCSK